MIYINFPEQPVAQEIYTNHSFETVTLLDSQAVRLGNDRDDIDDLAKFLHHDDINWS